MVDDFSWNLSECKDSILVFTLEVLIFMEGRLSLLVTFGLFLSELISIISVVLTFWGEPVAFDGDYCCIISDDRAFPIDSCLIELSCSL